MKLNINFNKISEKIKQFGSKNDNELLIIGLMAILMAVWIVLYLIPNIFVDLFNTILGKAILILFVILVSFKNLYYGMILLFVFIVIYRILTLSLYSNKKEGFTWNQRSTNKFLEIQKLINPEIVFDAQEIKKQATQEEVDYFNQHGHWPWSDEVKKLYKESLDSNPYVRTSSEDAIKTISTIYNEKAILQMLSWQVKEGQFLLNGVSINTGKNNPYEDLPSGWGNYAFNSKQISKNNNVIKCGYNNNNNNNKSGELSLQEIEYRGNDGIVYNHVKKITQVDYKNLEKLIPGFSFLKGPCNPCEALNNPPNYNCPFELNIRGTEKGISPVWQYLWNLVSTPASTHKKN
uniref:Uncharacterized protein n=1 Tax=viral metagenome TaxID=1070528 RepID=A0A6C0JEY1_9ZZZZ